MTTVLDNIQDGVLLIGVEARNTYRLLLANEAFLRQSGYPTDSINKLISDVVKTKKEYTRLIAEYKKVIDTKEKISYVIWAEVPLGRQAYEVKLLPVLNSVGECVQILAITRNVTELLRLRETLEVVNKSVDSALNEFVSAQ